MEGHLTSPALTRIFSGIATPPEVELAVPHLSTCRHCWRQASTIITSLRAEGRLASKSHEATSAAVVALIDEEQRSETEALRAESWWLELRDTLSLPEQLKRLESLPTLRTVYMVNAVLEDSERTAFSDPHRR